MISLQAVISAVDHRMYERSYHALRRARERDIDLDRAMRMLTTNLIDAYPMHGSSLILGMRLVTVMRCGGNIISCIWGDAYGYITLITIHSGRPHEEMVVSDDDYYYSMSDARQHAA